MNQQQAKKFFEEHKIRYVLAQFVDIHGAAKAKAVPVEHLEMVLTDGRVSPALRCGASAWAQKGPTTWRSAICPRCRIFRGCRAMRASSAMGWSTRNRIPTAPGWRCKGKPTVS